MYVLAYEFVVPAWSAGTQIDMDVCRRILRILNAGIHAGMTEICILTRLWSSVSS